MAYIESLKIFGFKKFQNFEINFNKNLNVLIGENESGKSTILEAIDIVLNPSTFKYSDSKMNKYFNIKSIKRFFEDNTQSTLPRIEIELFLNLNDTDKAYNFDGLHYKDSSMETKTGIRFVYEFDQEFINEVDFADFADNSVLPLDYYKLSWMTFQGKAYKRIMLNMNDIFLDNGKVQNDIYGSYSRKIYKAKIDEKSQRRLSSNFRQSLSKFKKGNDADLMLEASEKIGLDDFKSDLLNLIDIYDGDISLRNMGSGKENIIKTKLALSNASFDVVLIDEPENHLSHTRTRQLISMIKKITNSQIIIATHSSLIVNRLNLKNLMWIGNSRAHYLSDLSLSTSLYFEKIDNFDILRFILAEKVILVEGAAEYIILPSIIEKVTGKDLDSLNIDVISMGSISYGNFFEIVKVGNLDKKVLVFTDNDKKDIDTNTKVDNLKIYTDLDKNNWTLEVAFYNLNSEYFDDLYSGRKTKENYNNKPMEKAKAHMLKNKTNNALEIEKGINDGLLEIPEYLKAGIEWIVK